MLRFEDVADTSFRTTHRSEGYDTADVDAFRADVMKAIALRDSVIGSLQEELAAARARAVGLEVAPEPTGDDRRERSVAAARLLEMATVNADQLLADARAEAASLVDAARAEADHLVATSRDETDRANRELTERRAQQARELDRHRTEVLAEVADRKAALEATIFSLRQLENEHQDRLRRHFTEQLNLLDAITPTVPQSVAGEAAAD